MAKIDYGFGINNISGSLGGSTFSHNADGKYIRTKGAQCIPRSDAQSTRKAYFRQATAAWRGLTDAQRTAWKSYGQQSGSKANGYRLFVVTYLQYLNVGKTPISTPPAIGTGQRVDTADFVWTIGASTLTVDVTPAIAANCYVVVKMTPPLSQGVAMSRRGMKVVKVLTSASVLPLDIASDYTAAFGRLPQAGEICFAFLNGIPMPAIESRTANANKTGHGSSWKAGSELAKIVK